MRSNYLRPAERHSSIRQITNLRCGSVELGRGSLAQVTGIPSNILSRKNDMEPVQQCLHSRIHQFQSFANRFPIGTMSVKFGLSHFAFGG